MRIQPTGKGLSFLIIISLWSVLSTLTIALRIWARRIIRAFGADDYLMIVGWAIYMMVLSCDFLSINYGVGAHAERISEVDAEQAKKWFLFAGIGYAIATAPIKASICVLLIRLTNGTGRRIYRYILYGVIGLACVGTITRVTAYATRCKPFSGAWDVHGTCHPASILSNVTWFFSAVCITTDWICAALPMFVIWKLSLPLRQKVQIGCILALGMFASIATIIRMKHLIDYTRSSDYLFALTDVGLWSETEAFLGIVAGSLVTMRPLLRYIPCMAERAGSSFQAHNEPRDDSFKMQNRRDRSRGKNTDLENGVYMGHSFHITADKERSDSEDAASQKHILSDMDIVKETHYEVRSERSNEEDQSSDEMQRPARPETRLGISM